MKKYRNTIAELRVIYKRIFVAYFQPTTEGKFINNINGISVIHFLPA